MRVTGIDHVQVAIPRGAEEQARAFYGEALTLRFVPAREDLATFENITKPQYAQRAAIEACKPGQVLVVEGRGIEAAAGVIEERRPQRRDQQQRDAERDRKRPRRAGKAQAGRPRGGSLIHAGRVLCRSCRTAAACRATRLRLTVFTGLAFVPSFVNG